MRNKNALLVLLMTISMALAIGCSAVGDVMTPNPSTGGGGGGTDDLNPPGQAETINGGASGDSGAVDLQ